MREKSKHNWSIWLIFLFFIIVSFVMLLPLYYLILGSFRNSKDLFRYGMDLVVRPELMSLNNYKHFR